MTPKATASSPARGGRMSSSTSAPSRAAASSRSPKAIASNSRLSKGRKDRRPPTSPRRSSAILILHDGRERRAPQGRSHLKDAAGIDAARHDAPAAIVLFDLLADGDESLLNEPFVVRRERLERVLRQPTDEVRISESSPNGARMLERARKAGW